MAPALVSGPGRRPTELAVVRFFLLTLGVLLTGYTFLGRGFAHLGVPPVYLGEFVLALGLVATAAVALRSRLQIARSWLVVLLVAFMVLGLIRTVPYIPTYGADALRDATLWGYGVFALIILAVLDRDWVLKLFKLYGFVAVAFLVWGPISWNLFGYHADLIPNAPGSDIPILFFKNTDMAVQTAGAIAFLVVGAPPIKRALDFWWRFALAQPMSWMVYTTGSYTRGGLAAVAAALGVLAIVGGRTRNWAPLLAGAVLFAAYIFSNVSLPLVQPGPTPFATPTAYQSGQSPKPTATPSPTPTPTPNPGSPAGRVASTTQWWDNIVSIFAGSSDMNLEGTRQFRLAWWNKIIDYTFNGPYFWEGKGFGINLADSDGFQTLADHSLRAPHNSHLSVLARMGVPAFFLWIILQLGFALLLLRALLAHRRAGDSQLAAVAAWVLAFWTAMMINTSFDPYLEGPQGGIWFWSLFGLGLVLIRLAPKPAKRFGLPWSLPRIPHRAPAVEQLPD